MGNWIRCGVCSRSDEATYIGGGTVECEYCGARGGIGGGIDSDPTTVWNNGQRIAETNDGQFDCLIDDCEWWCPEGMEHIYHGHRVRDHDHFGTSGRDSLPTPPYAEIVMDGDTLGGKPRLAGHRIGVDHIGTKIRMGEHTIESVAEDVYPHLDVEQVAAALDYYDDHPVLMDHIRERGEFISHIGTSTSPFTAAGTDYFDHLREKSETTRDRIHELERTIQWAENEIRREVDQFQRERSMYEDDEN